MKDRAEIRAHCEEWGIGIMADVFDVVMDRELVDADDIAGVLDRLNPGWIYDRYIRPGIDRLEDAIAGGDL